MGIRILLGVGIGDEILERVKKAQSRIWIISPWVNREFADLLIQKAYQGVDVRLYTSNEKANLDTVNYLLHFMPSKERVRKSALLLIALGLMMLFLIYSGTLVMIVPTSSKYIDFETLLGIILLVSGIISVIVSLRRKRLKFPFYLVIFGETKDFLLHAKVYVIDNVAYIGSANFTQNGLYNNLEALVMSDDLTFVNDIMKQVEELPSKYNKYVFIERRPT